MYRSLEFSNVDKYGRYRSTITVQSCTCIYIAFNDCFHIVTSSINVESARSSMSLKFNISQLEYFIFPYVTFVQNDKRFPQTIFQLLKPNKTRGYLKNIYFLSFILYEFQTEYIFTDFQGRSRFHAPRFGHICIEGPLH